MKLVFVLCVVLAVAAQQVYSQACHLREIDLCISSGLFHYQSNGIPENEEKVNEWCETLTEIQQCLGNYTEKCLSPVQKELLALATESFNNAREMCKPGSDARTRYLQHAECLAGAGETDEFRTQVKDVQVGIETLFDVNYRQRFPLMCCSFRRFCKGVETLVEKQCGAESRIMMRDFITMIATDAFETVCHSFDPESNECKAVLPPSGTPSKGADNTSQLGKLLATALGD